MFELKQYPIEPTKGNSNSSSKPTFNATLDAPRIELVLSLEVEMGGSGSWREETNECTVAAGKIGSQ